MLKSMRTLQKCNVPFVCIIIIQLVTHSLTLHTLAVTYILSFWPWCSRTEVPLQGVKLYVATNRLRL